MPGDCNACNNFLKTNSRGNDVSQNQKWSGKIFICGCDRVGYALLCVPCLDIPQILILRQCVAKQMVKKLLKNLHKSASHSVK